MCKWTGVRARGALLAMMILGLAACGSGGKTVPPFIQGQVIGPGGGTLEVETVKLVVPPGAFDDDVIVAMLPQLDPLPIDPAAGQVEYLPGIICIGPLGHPLLVDGHVRMCYRVEDIPKGSTEADLVLLEWDELAGLMRLSPTAVQDLIDHCFDDELYGFLGHIAVGVRAGRAAAFDFVFTGIQTGQQQHSQLEIVPIPQGLVLADSTLGLTALPMAGTEGAGRYIGSRDGSRILYTVPNFATEGTALRTVDVGLTGPFTNREVLPEGTFTSSDGLYGWLGNQDRVFHERQPVTPAGAPLPTRFFSAKNGDGTGGIDDLEGRAGSTFIEDVRVSPDRSKAIVRWIEFTRGTETHVDTVDLTTGLPIALDLPTNTDSFDPTPRWLPDSTGIYFVEDDGVTVTRLGPDGTGAQTLYTLPVAGFLLDFVVAPPFAAPQRCAYVRRDPQFLNLGLGGGPDFYETDQLAGGDHTTFGLAGFFSVVEMVPLFSDDFQTSLVFLQITSESFDVFPGAVIPGNPEGHTLVFSVDGAFWTEIPVPLSNIDLSRSVDREGHMLVWVQQGDDSFPDFVNPGVYHLDPFAGNVEDVTPAGWLVTQPPRWLESWRFTPGFDSFSPKVR